MLSLDELMPSDEELGLLLQDAGEGPESNLLHAEQHHLLHQAILRIPAPLRIVLVLHDMEELTTEQVAQILDLRQGTVRIRLHRARFSVRKEMNQLLSGTAGEPDKRRIAARKRPKARDPRAGDAPTNAAICLPTFLSIWMEEWSLSHATRCGDISRLAHPAWHFCATCALPSTAAALWTFPATRLSHPDCAPSLTREYLRMLVLPAAK